MTLKKLPKCFYPSGLNSRFLAHGLTFSDYITLTQSIISHTRTDLTPSQHEQIILANSPYELRPKTRPKIKRGVLLIHGLFGSPSIFQAIANHLLSKDFLVRSILLPGHGTVPGDLLDIDRHSWNKAVEYGINSFVGEVEQLYLCGFSIGCTLSFSQALKNPGIKGLIFFSPAIKTHVKAALFAHFYQLSRRLGNNTQWAKIEDELNYAKYESVCWNALRQAYFLIKEAAPLQNAAQLKIPLFCALSEDDVTVDSHATLKFFSQLSHPASRLILYTNKKHAFKDPRIEPRNSAYLAEQIVDFSHVCIPVAPTDPHYGRRGDYKRPLDRDSNRKKEIRFGEKTPKNNKKYQLIRLNYNPDFDYMISRLDEFLEKV